MSLSTLGSFAKQPKSDLTVEQVGGAIIYAGVGTEYEAANIAFGSGVILGGSSLAAGGCSVAIGTLITIGPVGWVALGLL